MWFDPSRWRRRDGMQNDEGENGHCIDVRCLELATLESDIPLVTLP